MGNSTCQRILSVNRETLFTRWSDTYNEVIGSKLFLNTEIDQIIKKVKDSHFSSNIYNKLTPSRANRDLHSKSELESLLHEVKNLLPSRTLLETPSLTLKTEKLIKCQKNDPRFKKIEEYKLELCYVIHAWAAHLSHKLRDKTEVKDFLEAALNRYNMDEDSSFKNKLMVVSFNLFVEQFRQAVDDRDSEVYSKLLESLFEIVAAMGTREADFGFDKDSLQLGANFEQVAFSLMQILRENAQLEENGLRDVLNLLVKLVFYLGSVRLHLMLLGLIKTENRLRGLRIELPEQLSAQKLAKLPVFYIAQNPSKKFKLEESEFKSLAEFGRDSDDTLLILSTDRHFYLNSNKSKILVYDKIPRFETLKYITGTNEDIADELHYHQNEIYAAKFNDFQIGRLNLNNMSVDHNSCFVDTPYDFLSDDYLSPKLKSIKSRCLDWSPQDKFLLRYRDSRSAITPRLMHNDSYDSSKKDEQFERMLIITYSKKEPGEIYYNNYRQDVVTLGGEVFSEWITTSEDSNNGELKPGFIGDFFYVKNKVMMVVICVETAEVVSFQKFGDKSWPRVDGIDQISGEVFRLQSRCLEVFEAVNLLEFNPAAMERTSIGGCGVDEKRRRAIKKVIGISAVGGEDEDSESFEDTESNLDGAGEVNGATNGAPRVEEIQENAQNPKTAKNQKNSKSAKNGDTQVEFGEEAELFYYSYLDYLTRMLYNNKEDIQEICEKFNTKMKNFLYQADRIDNKAETFEVFYYLFHLLESAKTQQDVVLLIYVTKCFENHLEILSVLQENSKTGEIVSQQFLKKLRKKFEKLGLPAEKVASQAVLKHLRASRRAVSGYFDKLIKRHKEYNVADRVVDMLQNDVVYTFEDFLERVKMLGLTRINKILKKPISSNEQFLGQIFAKIKELSANLMEKESEKLIQLSTAPENFEKEKFGLSTLQTNLVNSLNSLIGIGFSQPVSSFVVDLIPIFTPKMQSTLEKVAENFKTKFVEKSEENLKKVEKILRSFDHFFIRSFLGHFYTTIVTLVDYLAEKNPLTPELKNVLRGLHIALINGVNSFGEWIDWSLTPPDSKETVLTLSAVGAGSRQSRTFEAISAETGYDVALSGPGITGLDRVLGESEAISVFRLRKGVVLNMGLTYDNMEHLHTWTTHNSHTTLRNIKFDTILVSRYNISSNLANPNKEAKISIKTAKHSWRSQLSIVNLAKVCLASLSKDMRDVAACKDSNPFLDEIGDQGLVDRLDKVLGSRLFEGGASESLFKAVDLDLDVSGLSELDIALMYQNHLFTNIGVDSGLVDGLIEYVKGLQAKVRSRNPLSRLGGKVGQCVATSLFLVVLKHQGLLQLFLKDVAGSEGAEAYLQTYQKCSKIRGIARNLQTKKELKSLFRKLLLVLSMDGSDAYTTIHGGLEPLGRLSSLDSPKSENQSETVFDQKTEKNGDSELKEDENEDNESPDRHRIHDPIQNLTLSPSKQRGGPDWNKVKAYLQSLRIAKNSNSDTPDTIIDTICSLAQLPTPSETILKVISKRLENFKKFTNAFKLMTQLFPPRLNSMMAEIFTLFQSIFRTSSNRLEPITTNLNGLPKALIDHQKGLIKQLVGVFVEYVCSEATPLNIKEMALDSLKWVYKGRESDCVLLIDVEMIWNSNKALESSQAVMESVLELIEILMNFCVRKIRQQGGGNTAGFEMGLSLRRHVSTIDETSMTNILNKNLSLLIEEMEASVAWIRGESGKGGAESGAGGVESVDMGEYLEYEGRRHFGGAFGNFVSHEVNCYNGEQNLVDTGALAYAFELEDAKETKEVKIYKKLVKSGLGEIGGKTAENGGDEAVNEVREVLDGEKKAEVSKETPKDPKNELESEVKKDPKTDQKSDKEAPKTPEQAESGSKPPVYIIKCDQKPTKTYLFSDFDKLLKTLKTNSEATKNTLRKVQRILLILYNAIIQIPETANCLFENEQNTETLFSLAVQPYPAHLQAMAINILAELSKSIPFEFFSFFEQKMKILEKYLILVWGDRREVLDAFRNNLMDLVVRLLSSEMQKNRVFGLFESLSQKGLNGLVLEILDVRTRQKATPGCLVTHKSDPRGLQYILLPKNAAFCRNQNSNYSVVTAVLRRSEDTYNDYETRFMLYREQAVYCLTSGHFMVFKKNELEVVSSPLKPDLVVEVVNRLKLVEFVRDETEGEGPDWGLRLRLANIVVQHDLGDLKDQLDHISPKEDGEGGGEAAGVPEIDISTSFAADLLKIDFEQKHPKIENNEEDGLEKAKNGGFQLNTSRENKFKTFSAKIRKSHILRRNQKTKPNPGNQQGSEATTKHRQTNMMLRRATACHQPLQNHLKFEIQDLPKSASKDKKFITRLLKTHLSTQIHNYQLTNTHKPTQTDILTLYTKAELLGPSRHKQALETKLGILLDRIGSPTALLQFVDELVNDRSSLDLKKLKKEYFRYKLAFKIAKKSKNVEFFQDLAEKIFDDLMGLIEAVYAQEELLDDPYASQCLLLLARNFRDILVALRAPPARLRLDFGGRGEQLEVLFRLGAPLEEWSFQIWYEKDCDELAVVYRHLALLVYLYTDFDRKAFREVRDTRFRA